MMFYKSCPRCEGDRSLENDFDGYYLLCLHCGHVAYPKIEPVMRPRQRTFESQPGPMARPVVEAKALPVG